MSARTINWTCQIEGEWEWMSAGNKNPSFSQPTRITGSITLEENERYEYPCIAVIKQNKRLGNTMLRYFQQAGHAVVQATVVAQGDREHKGPIGSQSVASYDGLTLIAELA